MKWIEVPIGSDQSDRPRLRGQVAECPDCHRREWWVFRLAGDPQLYVQCLYCDRIETPDGRPVADLVAYALDPCHTQPVVHPLSVPGKEVAL